MLEKGSEYARVQIAAGNILCNHNKNLMWYFKFLNGSRIICFPLKISEKLHWQHVFEKLKEAETHCLHLFYYDVIHRHPEEQHLPFKQTGTTTSFSFGYQSCTWPHSDPFCWKETCPGFNSGIDLVFALNYTLFQLCSNTE